MNSKIFKQFLLGGLMMAFSITPMWAQGISASSISGDSAVRGHVDDELGAPLTGAYVRIKGTTVGAMTDMAGDFVISNIGAGTYTLMVEYMGFETIEESVTVGNNETVVKNFVMSPGSIELSSVTVTGIREGQHKALNQQRNADNIKQVVSLDLMGRFPDLNVAEALQRLPGVTIGRERGEGADVQLRGTPANFTNININGEQIMGTQEEGNRNAQLDVIPVDVLSSMEVVKTLTPDLDGDAIAGVVNMKTPTAAKLDATGMINVGMGYNNLRNNLNGIGSFRFGKRFFATDEIPNGKLGVTANASYYQTKNGRDRIQAQRWRSNDFGDAGEYYFPEDFRYRYLESVRTRTGFSATVDYRFSPSTKILANFMYNNRNDDDTRYRRRFRMDNPELMEDGSYFDDRGRAYNQNLLRTQEVQNINLNLEGETKIGNVNLDGALFYTDSRRDYDSDALTYYSGRLPLTMQEPFVDYLSVEGNQDDTSIYGATTAEGYNVVTQGNNFVARLNANINYQMGTASGVFKAGIKSKNLKNERYIPENYYFGEYAGDGASVAEFLNGSNLSSDFMDNNLNFGFSVSPSVVSFMKNNLDQFELSEDVKRLTIDGYYYEAQENILAGYAMTKLQFNKVMTLLGVRVERTDVEYNANEVEQVEEGVWGGTTRVTKTNDYVKVLPNAQIKYDFDNNSVLRAALTFGYSRPNFTDLVPTININYVDQIVTLGNPDLEPAFATNVDLIYEKYLKNLGIISAGLFSKKIDKFQYANEALVTGDEFSGASEYDGWYYYNTLNGDKANVYGVELNLQSNMTFLPGILKGLTLFANYTYTDSKADTQTRQDLRLPGQATHSGNGTLAFNYKGFTIQGSANYNGSYTVGLGTTEETDIIRDDRWQFDMNASYRLTKKLTIYSEFNNITNAPQRDYYGDKSRVYDLEFYSWWCRFGAKYRF